MALIGTDAQNVVPPADCAVLQPEPLLVAVGHHPSHVRLRPGMLGEPGVGTGQYIVQDDVPIGRHLETNGRSRVTEGPAQGVGQRLVAIAVSAPTAALSDPPFSRPIPHVLRFAAATCTLERRLLRWTWLWRQRESRESGRADDFFTTPGLQIILHEVHTYMYLGTSYYFADL